MTPCRSRRGPCPGRRRDSFSRSIVTSVRSDGHSSFVQGVKEMKKLRRVLDKDELGLVQV